MPCYDPPPPWQGAQKESAELAARLLCGIVRARLERGETPERELLAWFAGHREIDRQIATTGYYGDPDAVEAAKALWDIERAKMLLAHDP
jgi:hypothetical protein